MHKREDAVKALVSLVGRVVVIMCVVIVVNIVRATAITVRVAGGLARLASIARVDLAREWRLLSTALGLGIWYI